LIVRLSGHEGKPGAGMNRSRNERRIRAKPASAWIVVFLASLVLVHYSDSAAGQSQTRAGKTENKGMDISNLHLTAVAREKSGWLYPEQSAFFDFTLHNAGAEPAEVLAFYDNATTPRYRIYDSAGKLIRELSIRDLENRYNAGMGEPVPEEPKLMTVAPGKAKIGWVDLWSYTAPLPAGRYEFAIAHQLAPSVPGFTESNRVPFQVVDAEVSDVAVSYADQERSTSLVAWLAGPPHGDARILLRESAISRHGSAQRSGMPIGTVPKDSRLSLGMKTNDGPSGQESWLAITHRGPDGHTTVDLVQTFEAAEAWRSKPIELPIDEAYPVPGFPDRRAAVFLATGLAQGKPVLAGVKIDPENAAGAWQIPLGFRPVRAACIFGPAGPVSVVLARHDNQTTRLTLLDIMDDGKVSLAEREVWSGEGELLELTSDMRPGTRTSVLALISDPKRPDHLKLVRITAAGESAIVDFGVIPGWPTIIDHVPDPNDKTGQRTTEVSRPAKVRRAQLAVAGKATVLLALIDEKGFYYGGRLGETSQLRLISGPAATHVIFPQIVVLGGQAFFAGFTDRGALAHFGGY
jgi:hypothetical protein